MRVVIAPDKFAGTLSAVQAAEAIAEGWRSCRPDDDLALAPVADGGEGTVDVIAHARPDAVRHVCEVADARGIATQATWLALPDGTAVVEVAQACGLTRLEQAHRDPLRTTSYGVGQLLRAVLDTEPSRLIIGLGGTATVDGGAGMISALTCHRLRRADGNAVRVGGRWVAESVTLRGAEGRPVRPDRLPPVVLASDVTNPLLGPDGAAHVFGPQKGADAAAVTELERALGRLADVVERDLPGGPWRDRAGAGAAGGLGFALMALLGAEVRSGAEVVTGLVGLRLDGADVVVTGEGSLDAQSLAGKAPVEVARAGRDAGARTVAIAGRLTPEAAAAFDVAVGLGPDGLTDARGSLVRAAVQAASTVGEEA